MNKKLISIPHQYQGYSLTYELSVKIEDVIERLDAEDFIGEAFE